MNGALYQRLEQVDAKWSFDVVHTEVAGGEVLVSARLSMTGTCRTAFGSSRVNGGTLADAANRAADAALENAAIMLGLRAESETPQPRPANDHTNGNGNGGNTPAAEKLTAKQLSAIHAICRRRNINQGELADQLAQRWGKTAPQFLTKREASELLDELSANGASAR